MEVVANNYLPGDQRLVDKIVYELKAQGIFDQFRKECFADVDTKPAYQNLRQRVEGSVSGFLKEQSWRPDMNKNQVREMLRKRITESGYLETGVERIVDQVVNPKINSVFLPKVEEVVYSYLGIKKPAKNESLKSGDIDLLPNDLEAVSPESEPVDRKDDKSGDNFQDLDESKTEEDESPPFEPLDEQLGDVPQEENSVDSHLSGFSGLISHESNQTNENKITPMEQDSQMSRNSSDSRLSIVTSDDNSKADKMDVCEDSQSKSIKSNDSNHNSKHESKHKSSSDRHKSRSESKSDKDRDKDSRSHHSSSSKDKDKSRDRDRKDSKSSSKDKPRDKDREKDKDRSKSSNKYTSSSSSSSKDKNRKDSRSDKDKDKDKDKEKKSSSSSSSSHKDSKSRDKSRDKSSSDKHRHSSSSHSHKKDKDKKKDKPKDDHYSSKDKKNDRRSTDRDSNDGSTKLSTSQPENPSSSQSQKGQDSNKTSNPGNSDQSENTTKAPVILNVDNAEVMISPPERVKVLKPKCASNIQEALKLMKIRKQLAKLEKQNQLSLASVDVTSPIVLNSSINLDDLNQNCLKKEKKVEEVVPLPLQNTVITKDNWDAMEAKLREEVSSEFEDDDGEKCKFFESVDIKQIEFLQFVERFIKNVEKYKRLSKRGVKRKIEDNDLKNNNNNNNKKVVPEKKPKVGKRTKVNNNVSANGKFALPLSPAESDKSSGKKEEVPVAAAKKRNSVSKASSQRYSSDDLYKPRSTFTSTRRRGAKNLEN